MKVETTTGRASESGHFYGRDGSPVYEIRGTNGLMRPATLRDARKLGLVPGVSTILAMEAKPMLVRWQIEQALMAAITLPRRADESDDAFILRAREDAQAQAAKARDRGTEIHALVQGSFEGQKYPKEVAPFIDPIRGWISQRFGLEGWRAEHSFAHPSGYGGKSDLMNPRGIVLDIKCKEFDQTKAAKDLAWPEHAMQLAAYADGFGFSKPDCANVFISTSVPGLIQVREWDTSEIDEAREAFGLLLRLYKIRKKYDPSFTTQEAA